MRFAIIDIETAGYPPGHYGSGITEIAIVIHDGEQVIETYETLINPLVEISAYVSKLTGITDDMVSTAPTFEQVADHIDNLTRDCVFVAHSVNFDYSYIASAFKRLGVEFTRRKICTVRYSREMFPGDTRYGLGHICSRLNISIENRHRAMGDAFATAQLFKLCFERDKDGFLEKALKKNSRETLLPPNLSRKVFNKLPNANGVYYFHDENGKVIYVGKAINIRKRIESHFSGRSKKLSFFTSISNITWTVCATELIALLHEAAEIKRLFPKYNSAQKFNRKLWVLAGYTDHSGTERLLITRSHKQLKPLHTFSSFDQARSFLFRMIEEFELCPRYCGLHLVQGACYDYEKSKCKGACAGIEQTEIYNKRVHTAIDKFRNEKQSRLIIANGRRSNEKSVVVIEDGIYKGFGYYNSRKEIRDIHDALKIISPARHTSDIHQILALHS